MSGIIVEVPNPPRTLGAAADVNLVTNPPVEGSKLYYDGTQWVPGDARQYTPTGTADPSGFVGEVTYDANFLYVRTAAGWGRIALDFVF